MNNYFKFFILVFTIVLLLGLNNVSYSSDLSMFEKDGKDILVTGIANPSHEYWIHSDGTMADTLEDYDHYYGATVQRSPREYTLSELNEVSAFTTHVDNIEDYDIEDVKIIDFDYYGDAGEEEYEALGRHWNRPWSDDSGYNLAFPPSGPVEGIYDDVSLGFKELFVNYAREDEWGFSVDSYEFDDETVRIDYTELELPPYEAWEENYLGGPQGNYGQDLTDYDLPYYYHFEPEPMWGDEFIDTAYGMRYYNPYGIVVYGEGELDPEVYSYIDRSHTDVELTEGGDGVQIDMKVHVLTSSPIDSSYYNEGDDIFDVEGELKLEVKRG